MIIYYLLQNLFCFISIMEKLGGKPYYAQAHLGMLFALYSFAAVNYGREFYR